MNRQGHPLTPQIENNGRPKYLGKAGTPESGPESAAKKPTVTSKRNGEISNEKVPEGDGALMVETGVEQITRKGEEVLKKFLKSHLKQLEILEARSEGLEKRIAFKDKIEQVLYTQKFFEGLEPREKMLFWRLTDVSIQTEAGLSQMLQAQGDIFQSYHNVKNLVDHLIYLEREKELNRRWTPPDPGFRAYLYELYAKKIQLEKEKERRNNKEKVNGRKEMDNGATEETEPSN